MTKFSSSSRRGDYTHCVIFFVQITNRDTSVDREKALTFTRRTQTFFYPTDKTFFYTRIFFVLFCRENDADFKQFFSGRRRESEMKIVKEWIKKDHHKLLNCVGQVAASSVVGLLPK